LLCDDTTSKDGFLVEPRSLTKGFLVGSLGSHIT